MLCLRKLLVANKIMDERETGDIKTFRRKFFVPQCPKSFAREAYCVVFQKISCSEKDYELERGISSSSVEKYFCLRVPIVSYGKTSMLCCRKLLVARNSMDKRRGSQDFPSKVFCTTMPKTLAREPICVVFQKTSGSEKVFG